MTMMTMMTMMMMMMMVMMNRYNWSIFTMFFCWKVEALSQTNLANCDTWTTLNWVGWNHLEIVDHGHLKIYIICCNIVSFSWLSTKSTKQWSNKCSAVFWDATNITNISGLWWSGLSIEIFFTAIGNSSDVSNPKNTTARTWEYPRKETEKTSTNSRNVLGVYVPYVYLQSPRISGT